MIIKVINWLDKSPRFNNMIDWIDEKLIALNSPTLIKLNTWLEKKLAE